MSTNTVDRRTDFHPVTAGYPPIPLQISICPTCGYSGSIADYESPVEITPEIKKKIAAELTPQIKDGIPNQAIGYAFAARIAEWEGAEAIRIADLFLLAAWCAVDEYEAVDDIPHRLSAIEYFKRALEEDQVPSENRQNVTYLIGELYRRVGDVAQAGEWFDKAIGLPDNDQITKLARQQRDDPKETMKEVDFE
jgi:tetratricopeptide (TPR) repeat protein